MSYIELVDKKYESLEDLYSLIQYIFNLNKTAGDSRRANLMIDTLTGCKPSMLPDNYMSDATEIYNMMLFQIKRRRKKTTQFAKHRIISFSAADYILPQDLVSLAEEVVRFYRCNGFIAAYGIHADTNCSHVHFAVCTVSFQTLNMFNMRWEEELGMLRQITACWESEFKNRLINDIKMRLDREELLYGDDIKRYGRIPLTTAGQIRQNRRIKMGD